MVLDSSTVVLLSNRALVDATPFTDLNSQLPRRKPARIRALTLPTWRSLVPSWLEESRATSKARLCQLFSPLNDEPELSWRALAFFLVNELGRQIWGTWASRPWAELYLQRLWLPAVDSAAKASIQCRAVPHRTAPFFTE